MKYYLDIVARGKKRLKRFQRSDEYFNKRFDLGFITEEEFIKRRIKMCRKFALEALADAKESLTVLNLAIKQEKLTLTRLTQRAIIVLAQPDRLQRIGKEEEHIRKLECFFETNSSCREKCKEQIKILNEVLKMVS